MILLPLYETVAELVKEREQYLTEFIEFECMRGDPRRYFMGKSTELLNERKTRATLDNHVSAATSQLIPYLSRISAYGETVTYMGTNYLEKMSHDVAEALGILRNQKGMLHQLKSIHRRESSIEYREMLLSLLWIDLSW